MKEFRLYIICCRWTSVSFLVDLHCIWVSWFGEGRNVGTKMPCRKGPTKYWVIFMAVSFNGRGETEAPLLSFIRKAIRSCPRGRGVSCFGFLLLPSYFKEESEERHGKTVTRVWPRFTWFRTVEDSGRPPPERWRSRRWLWWWRRPTPPAPPSCGPWATSFVAATPSPFSTSAPPRDPSGSRGTIGSKDSSWLSLSRTSAMVSPRYRCRCQPIQLNWEFFYLFRSFNLLSFLLYVKFLCNSLFCTC